MRIVFSENESNQLGLRTGRVRMEELNDLKSFRQEILKQEFDLVKLKINAQNPDVLNVLNNIGFPHFVNSILYRNKIMYAGKTLQALPKGFSYELYSPAQHDLFKQMLEEIFDHTTGINYTHPFYRLFVSNATEKKMAVSYYLQFNSASSPDKRVWLLKKGRTYIGFVCGQFLPQGFEGIWYGVLPAYRSKGFSALLLDVIEIECRKQSVKAFYNDVQYQNIYSQMNVTKNGAVPIASYLNIFLLPCISIAQNKGLVNTNLEKKSNHEIAADLLKEIRPSAVRHVSFWSNSNSKPSHYTVCDLAKGRFVIHNFYSHKTLIAQQTVFS